jgi:hypothetical protein
LKKKDEEIDSQFVISKNLQSLLLKSGSQENQGLKSNKLFYDINPLANEIDNQTRKENFAKQCKVINDYNELTKMISSQDLFEYSLVGNKKIKTNFIRCVDFFKEGTWKYIY